MKTILYGLKSCCGDGRRLQMALRVLISRSLVQASQEIATLHKEMKRQESFWQQELENLQKV